MVQDFHKQHLESTSLSEQNWDIMLTRLICHVFNIFLGQQPLLWLFLGCFGWNSMASGQFLEFRECEWFEVQLPRSNCSRRHKRAGTKTWTKKTPLPCGDPAMPRIIDHERIMDWWWLMLPTDFFRWILGLHSYVTGIVCCCIFNADFQVLVEYYAFT